MHVPIVPLTFTNNYALFSDPEQWLGPARPGMFNVYIHPYIERTLVEQLTEKELADHCFQIINAPILSEHPHLA